MSPFRRRLILCGVVLSAAVGLLLLLNHAKFASSFESRLQHRIAITARDAAEALEGQIALGIPLSDTPALSGLLERSRRSDPAIESLTLFDARSQPLLAVGPASTGLPQQALAGLSARRSGQALQDGHAALAMGLTNAFGVDAGALVLQYRLEEAQTNTREAFASLQGVAAIALAAALLLLLASMIALRRRLSDAEAGAEATSGPRLTLLLSVLLLGVQLAIAVDAYRSLDRLAVQEAPSLAQALAHTLEPALQRALESGIPLDELQGTESWLRSALGTGPEFAALTLLAPSGDTLGSSARPAESRTALLQIDVALRDGTKVLAGLRVGLDPRALAERTRQMVIEFLMLLLTGGLLIHEVLRALTLPSPAPRGATDVQGLRFPLFLFFLGSELPRSFLPLWADELALKTAAGPAADGLLDTLLAPLRELPHSLQASLPISIFLFAVALASPLAGRYCARAGAHRLLKLGLLFALAGHVCAALAEAMPLLMLARTLAGISFGCVSLAALDHIGQQAAGRAAGMAMYLAAYVSAGIAGAGLGALIFDRAGTTAVFGAGILCSLVATGALLRFPSAPTRAGTTASLSSSIGLLLRTRGFQKLILLASLPLQIVQQGLLFYWAPLAILAIGEKTSLTGLAMMAYFAIVLLLNKPLARLADRKQSYRVFLAMGLALAGVAGLLGIAVGAESAGLEGLTPYRAPMILSAIVLIGVAWALAFPSQGALALAVSRAELPGVDSAITLGVYRTIERVGAMITPILTSALISLVGLSGTAVTLGALLLVCALAQSRFQRLAQP